MPESNRSAPRALVAPAPYRHLSPFDCDPWRGSVLRAFIPYLPAVAWAAVVLGIGSLTSVPQPAVGIPLDKAAHFAMYAILGALAARGWVRSGRRPGPLLPLLFVVCVGAADELHQRTVPERSPELADWAADIAGGLAGFTIIARRASTQPRTDTR